MSLPTPPEDEASSAIVVQAPSASLAESRITKKFAPISPDLLGPDNSEALIPVLSLPGYKTFSDWITFEDELEGPDEYPVAQRISQTDYDVWKRFMYDQLLHRTKRRQQ